MVISKWKYELLIHLTFAWIRTLSWRIFNFIVTELSSLSYWSICLAKSKAYLQYQEVSASSSSSLLSIHWEFGNPQTSWAPLLPSPCVANAHTFCHSDQSWVSHFNLFPILPNSAISFSIFLLQIFLGFPFPLCLLYCSLKMCLNHFYLLFLASSFMLLTPVLGKQYDK